MPRTARIIAPNCLYHIICRGNNQQIIFSDETDFERYLRLLKKYKSVHPFALYNYVLMNNHVHLLLEPSSAGALASVMLKLNLAYAHYFQKKYGGTGHLWQGRYKSILVAKDAYCLACAVYVELNPVVAQIAQTPESYLWSSYRFYAFREPNALLSPNPLYEGFGNNPDERMQHYRKFVLEAWEQKKFKEEEMDRLRYLGSPEFVSEQELLTGIPNISKRGRPNK